MNVYFESNKENLIKSPIDTNNSASNVVTYHHILSDGTIVNSNSASLVNGLMHAGKILEHQLGMEVTPATNGMQTTNMDPCNKINLLGMDTTGSKHLLMSALLEQQSSSPPPSHMHDELMDENDPSLKEIEDSLAMSPNATGTSFSNMSSTDLTGTSFNASVSSGPSGIVSNHTFKKTEWDVKKFENHVRTVFGDTQPMESMQPEILNTYINNFFEYAKKGDGMEYEPESLIGYMNSFERYLKAKNYPESLLRSDIFSDTRSMLKRKRDLVRTIGRLVRIKNKDTPYLLKFYRNLFKEKGLLNRENPDCLLAEVRTFIFKFTFDCHFLIHFNKKKRSISTI
jgi:hypothetical protein